MQITISAGKGGTGKTTVAVSLALALKDNYAIQFLDCDVEEPDSKIFLKPELQSEESVNLKIPYVNDEVCTYCGECGEACQFNAIATFGENTLVYPELCHGCGLCSLVCPVDAITEEDHKIGELRSGTANGIAYHEGDLTIGSPMATPIISELKKKIDPEMISILDSPPGTACPVIESLHGSDFALLVTEPTLFGLHDLKLSVDVVREMGIPLGVVINRNGIGDEGVEHYCETEDIPVLLRIPDDRTIAEHYSNGIPFIEKLEGWKEKFLELFQQIEDEVELQSKKLEEISQEYNEQRCS